MWRPFAVRDSVDTCAHSTRSTAHRSALKGRFPGATRLQPANHRSVGLGFRVRVRRVMAVGMRLWVAGTQGAVLGPAGAGLSFVLCAEK